MTREQWKNRKFKPTELENHHYWEKTEMTDKELWSSAYNATASANDCKSSSMAVKYADKALTAWNEYNIRGLK